jgi:hypothetical protein
MGYALSWLAFKDLPPETGLARLGLVTGSRLAAYAREPLSGQSLRGGWFLVVMKGSDHPLVSESSLSALSAQSQVVACSVEEHVMFSSAEGWTNSERNWRVEHDAQQSARHLVASGWLPAAYAEVLRKAQEAHEAQQADDTEAPDVDFFFEVPLEVALNVAGFKHDVEIPGINYGAFQVYDVPPGTARRKWWQMWK